MHRFRFLVLVTLAIVLCPPNPTAAQEEPAAVPLTDQIRIIGRDVDRYWRRAFLAAGVDYERATVTLITDTISTDCGEATEFDAAFYCPWDGTVYLAEPFLIDTVGPYGSGGLAQVIAHEWGHHVQSQLGIWSSDLQDAMDTRGATRTYGFIRELQADCLAGTYIRYADGRDTYAPRDVDAAVALLYDEGGDPDGASQGEPGAHGTPAQRVRFYLQGYYTGETFSGCGALPLPAEAIARAD